MTDVYQIEMAHAFTSSRDAAQLDPVDYFPLANDLTYPRPEDWSFGKVALAEMDVIAYPSPRSLLSRDTGSPAGFSSEAPELDYLSSDSSSFSDASSPTTPGHASLFGAFKLGSDASLHFKHEDIHLRLPTRASFSGVPTARPSLRPRLSMQGLQKRYACNVCPWQTNFVEYMERHCLAHEGRAFFDCVLGECSESFDSVEAYLAHIDDHEEIARQEMASSEQLNHRRESSSSSYSSCSSATSSSSSSASMFTGTYDSVAPQLTIAPPAFDAPWSAPPHITSFEDAESSRAPVASFKASMYESSFFAAAPRSRTSSSDDDDCEFDMRSSSHGASRSSRDSMLAKVHKCSHAGCDKAFKRREHCKRHEKIHTEERPWQCEVCERCFTRKDNLAAHRRTHEKMASLSVARKQQSQQAQRKPRA